MTCPPSPMNLYRTGESVQANLYAGSHYQGHRARRARGRRARIAYQAALTRRWARERRQG